ncbi:MAG: dipeptidase [Planctomycetaceae bacterium]
MDKITSYLADNADRYVDELSEYLRIQSVSADSQFQPHMVAAAEFTRDKMADAGLETKIIETDGHPVVYGERIESPDLPTALVYGHYDVQPPDPHDEWETPAFEPTVRDGKISARGATDDKGQLYTHVKSVEAWTKREGKLPCNVKFVIEGEEEVGSPNLNPFLEANKDMLTADVAVISDTSQYAPGIPALTHGLRGLVAIEVELTGPSQDLHSGMFGGSIANPVNALAKLVASLVDDEGRIQIPGFYDNVVEQTDEERKGLADLPFDEAAYLKQLGVDAAFGEAGYSTLERRWARPTCDVNGIFGGYSGEGPKTIVPSKATAKITCRLVPNQTPDKIVEAIESYLRDQVRPGLKFSFKSSHNCEGLLFDPNGKWMGAAVNAIEASFGRKPVFTRGGGSIPVVGSFKEILDLETLLLGWGLNTDNLHSPNEHFTLADYQRGIVASAFLWKELAAC